MRTIVITGASDGIGASAARILHHARPDDHLVLVGRDPDKTAAAAKPLGAEYHTADFIRLDEVRELADNLAHLERIDVLANNAGGTFAGPERTVDGFEKNWQINVAAPYLLTNLLFPVLLRSHASVVASSSIGALLLSDFDVEDPNTWERFTPDRAYGNAKLGNIFITKALHHRFHDHGLSTVAFHPGVVDTNFWPRSAGLLARFYSGPTARLFASRETGGKNLAHYVAGTPGIHWESGRYYDEKRRPGRQRPIAKDLGAARRVFDDLATALDVSW